MISTLETMTLENIAIAKASLQLAIEAGFSEEKLQPLREITEALTVALTEYKKVMPPYEAI